MYIMIRRYKTDSPTEVTRFANEGFFPPIADVAGLVAYCGIESYIITLVCASTFASLRNVRFANCVPCHPLLNAFRIPKIAALTDPAPERRHRLAYSF